MMRALSQYNAKLESCVIVTWSQIQSQRRISDVYVIVAEKDLKQDMLDEKDTI